MAEATMQPVISNKSWRVLDSGGHVAGEVHKLGYDQYEAWPNGCPRVPLRSRKEAMVECLMRGARPGVAR